MKKNNHTIIFIPGFKGSTLVNQEGTLIWPNVIKSQFDHKTSLSNDLPELNIDNPNHYQSREIIDSVTIIPGFYKYTIYGKFINALKKYISLDHELIFFHYDWRQDLMITIAQLKVLIERIIQENSGPIDIICHSMGGLITSYILQTMDVNVIRKVFFIAVPFQGSPKILIDLIYGSRLGLNKTLLSTKAMSSFPSVYYLLPRYFDAIAENDLFDLNTWEKLKLGYLTKHNDKKQLNFLTSQLEAVNEFYKKLESVEHIVCNTTKLIFINNHVYSTPTQIQFTPEMNIITGSGDGSVPEISLNIPDYFKDFNQETYHIDKSHALSFTSNELISIVLKHLI